MELVDLAFELEIKHNLFPKEVPIGLDWDIVGHSSQMKIVLSIRKTAVTTQLNYSLITPQGYFYRLPNSLYLRSQLTAYCNSLSIAVDPRTRELQFRFAVWANIDCYSDQNNDIKYIFPVHQEEINGAVKIIEKYQAEGHVSKKQKHVRICAKIAPLADPDGLLKAETYQKLAIMDKSEQKKLTKLSSSLQRAVMHQNMFEVPLFYISYHQFEELAKEYKAYHSQVYQSLAKKKAVSNPHMRMLRWSKADQSKTKQQLQNWEKWTQNEIKHGKTLTLSEKKIIKMDVIDENNKKAIYDILGSLSKSIQYAFLPIFFLPQFSPPQILVYNEPIPVIPLPQFFHTHQYLSLINRLRLWLNIVAVFHILWEKDCIAVRISGMTNIGVLPEGKISLSGLQKWIKIDQSEKKGKAKHLRYQNLRQLSKLYFYIVYRNLFYYPRLNPFPVDPPLQPPSYTFIEHPMLADLHHPPKILLDLTYIMQKVIVCKEIVNLGIIMMMCKLAIEVIQQKLA